jgi:hypothetical protein
MVLNYKRPHHFLIVTGLVLIACNKPAPIVAPPNKTGDSTNAGAGAGAPTDTSTATVYVLGTSGGDSLVCWKNGVPTLLAYTPDVFACSMVMVDSDIYIAAGYSPAGTNPSDITDTPGIASYWKDGQQYPLSLSEGAVGAVATGIFVSGSDVYVSGTMHFNDPTSVPFTPRWGFTACYWKNGQPTLLTDWAATVSYFGYLQSVRSDFTSGIFVSGNDVYVAGGERYPINHPLPFHFTGYWKDDAFVDLPNYLTDSNVTTQLPEPITGPITMNGTDLYVSGNQQPLSHRFPTGLYWQNGTLISLWPDSGDYVYNLQISGNDIYNVGNYYLAGTQHAAYWKDGSMTLVDSSIYGTAGYSICVSGNDVYVAGNRGYIGIAYPVYWKNGVLKNLGYNGTAYEILVK